MTPIIVRPAVSKLIVTTIGRWLTERAPSTAAVTSSRWLIVSIHSTSTPPSARPAAWAANAFLHSSIVIVPSGSSRSPVGPIEPATSTGRPAPSAAVRAADRGGPVELLDAVVEAVELEPEGGAAERVGQHDVGPGGNVVGVHRGDTVGLLDVPALGRLARRETVVEQLGAHGAVEQHRAAVGDQVGERVHGVQCAAAASATRRWLRPSAIP